MAFKPALIVVDMQNDFCPPTGSLAVPGGRDLVPLINQLLRSDAFTFKVATQDYHPQDHISFASNHEPPNNKPFESMAEVKNVVAGKPHETMQQRLWPDHCVQGSEGAKFVDGLDVSKVDIVVQKGMDTQVEMYSAFTDTFGNMTAGGGGVSHDLASILHDKDITHVYVVGLAGDYCVASTATGARKAGFTTYIIEEGQRCIGADEWSKAKVELRKAGIEPVELASNEVKRLGIAF